MNPPKATLQTSVGDGTVPYLGCARVSILAVTVPYRLVRYSHWGELDKIHRIPLHYVVQWHVNPQLPQNVSLTKNIKNKTKEQEIENALRA